MSQKNYANEQHSSQSSDEKEKVVEGGGEMRKGEEEATLIFLHAHPQADVPELDDVVQFLRQRGLEMSVKTKQDNDKSGLFLRINQEMIPYSGSIERHAELADWILRKLIGAKTIHQKSQLEELIKEEKSILVGFFPFLDTAEAKLFNKFASKTEELHCYVISDNQVIQELKQEDTSIVLYKDEEEEPEVLFMDPVNQGNLERFVHQNNAPLVAEFKQDNARKVLSAGVRLHLLLVSSSADPLHKNRIRMLKLIAKNYRKRILFVHVDAKTDNYPMLTLLGVRKENVPAVYIVNLETGERWLLEGGEPLTVASINNFIQQCTQNKIEANMRTGTVTNSVQEGPVKSLVTSNLADQMKENVYTFILFYVPWSETCEKVSGVWENLAKEFQPFDNITLAKMDVVENELTDSGLSEYPSIGWTSPNTSQLQFYYGKFGESSLRTWITSGGEEEVEEDLVVTDQSRDEEDAVVDIDYTDDRELENLEDVEEEDDARQRIRQMEQHLNAIYAEIKKKNKKESTKLKDEL